MKLSAVVRKYTSKDGRTFFAASSKGKFLAEVKKIDHPAEDETTFDIKIVAGTGALPQAEGVYEITCEDAWKDTREEIKFPTVRVKGVSTSEKKCDLKPLTK